MSRTYGTGDQIRVQLVGIRNLIGLVRRGRVLMESQK